METLASEPTESKKTQNMDSKENHIKIITLRIRLARLEKLNIPQEEIEAAEEAIADWEDIKAKVDELDAEFFSDNPDTSGCLTLAEELGEIQGVAEVLATVLEESREAVLLVRTRAELNGAERECYDALMANRKAQ